MSLPKVNVNINSGQLGRIAPPEDGVSLLVCTVAGGAGLKGVYLSLNEAEDDGITQAYDVANNALVHQHVSDFYRNSAPGTELHLMLLSDTKNLADIFDDTDPSHDLIRNYLASKEGKIKLLGVATNPAVEPIAGDGANVDLVAAIPLAQAFRALEFTADRPIQIFLEGRQYTGSAASATDLRALESNRVSVMIARDKKRWADLATLTITKAQHAAQLGTLLGRLSAVPVQRNIGRVADGALPLITEAELSGGQNLTDIDEVQLGAINAKGYITYRKHMGKNGYFFTDDPTCSSIEDDFSFVTRGRVMDKAVRIVRQTLLEELSDETDVDAQTGFLPAAEVKGLEALIEKEINTRMTALGNISAVEVYVDPEQNVLATDTIETQIDITPKGIKSKLKATVQFRNPANV